MATLLSPVAPTRAAIAISEAVLNHWPRYGSVAVTYEVVSIGALKSVIWVASSRRLYDAVELANHFEAQAIPAFLPVILHSSLTGTQVMFGPLIEENAKGLVVLDGLHRILAARQAGLLAVHAAKLRALQVPPPAGPLVAVADMAIHPGMDDPPKVFEGKGNPNYRPSSLFLKTATQIFMNEIGDSGESGNRYRE